MANPRGFSQTGIELLNAELAKRGISPPAASGAIAGIMGESGANLDPTSFNSKDPGGGSGGVGQWNRGRLIGQNGMLAFAKGAGVPVDVNSPMDAKKVPLAIQAQYLGHELDTTYAGVAKQLRGATNPQDALNIWVKSYESPLDTQGAIRQRSQYLAPVATALGNAPTPGTTLNSSGASTAPTGGPAAPAAPGQPGQPSGGLAGSLPGFQPNSPGAKMTAKGLQAFGGGAGGSGEPPPMPSMQSMPPQATGGPMMMHPGGQNVPGRSMAPDPRTGLAQLAAYGSVQPLSQASAPSLATGMPTSGLQGTTLNSPSQLQMALMSGSLSPYDMYARQQTSGFGSM